MKIKNLIIGLGIIGFVVWIIAAIGDIFYVSNQNHTQYFQVDKDGNASVSGDIRVVGNDIYFGASQTGRRIYDDASNYRIKISTAITMDDLLLPHKSSLPTSGYTTGYMLLLTSDWKVYVSTEVVSKTQSWKALW